MFVLSSTLLFVADPTVAVMRLAFVVLPAVVLPAVLVVSKRNTEWTDPPKAVADIVESMLGAVHVDGGFDAGQSAVLQTMAAVLEDVIKTDCDSFLLRHPTAVLHNMGGTLVETTLHREDAFVKNRSGPAATNLVWNGQTFHDARKDGNRMIGSVRALGRRLVSVVDTSKKSTKNRASALVAAVIQRDEELQERLRQASIVVSKR